MPKIDVTYCDGRTESVQAGARQQVEMERRYKGVDIDKLPRIEASFFMAWHGGSGRRDGAGFEDWLDTVSDIKQEKADAGEDGPDPSSSAQPPGP